MWSGYSDTTTTTTTTISQSSSSVTAGTVVTYYVNTQSTLPDPTLAAESFTKKLKAYRPVMHQPPLPVRRAPPKEHLRARHSFQQMCRVPCYRSARAR